MYIPHADFFLINLFCFTAMAMLVIPEGFSKSVVNYHGAIHRMQHLFLSETVFVSLKSVQQKPSCAS